MDKITISDLQKKVLVNLVEFANENEEGWCKFFKGIASETGLEIKKVRLACRALARKKLAEYNRGLFDDDGMVVGSGYCATRAGIELINSETPPLPLEK